MNSDDNLRSLEKWGDPLEQAIVENEALLPVLVPYACIWARHLLVRRDKQHRYVKSEEWYEFGAHHYTALIRVENAYRSLRQIREACCTLRQQTDAKEALLDLHLAIASFWENLGCAIENLEKALQKIVRSGTLARQGAVERAFAKRSRLIHGLIVPVATNDQSIEFYVSHLEDEDDKKGWHQPKERTTEWVEQHHDDEWVAILAGLASAWESVNSQLPSAPQPENPISWFAETSPLDAGIRLAALSGTLPPTLDTDF